MSKTELSNIPKEIIAEFNQKKAEVDLARVGQQYEQLQEQKRDLDFLESFDLNQYNSEYAKTLAKESTEYLLKARESKVFINDDFRGKIPFFPRNIILCAAETGTGKSTISANLACQALRQGQKVLVIVNEENPTDVYNRVTCILRGWSYANHEKFTDEQVKVFEEQIPILSERLVVVSDTYNGKSGCTTTIEGIEATLNSLIKKQSNFDVILIDYYQNIDRSVKAPNLADWQVQYRFCKYLDQFKNRSNACIVVLAQKKTTAKDGKEEKISFKDAIEGRKSILNVATCAINIVKDSENYCTLFEIKKSRFSDCIGDVIRVGFNRGEYVRYTTEFKNQAQNMRAEKEQKQLMAKVNPTGLNNGG